MFYETNLKGSGSLLEVGSLAQESYGTEAAESFEVDVTTLDTEFPDRQVDCLWIDVQGAEGMVLAGASDFMKRTKSVFIEVSVYPDLYEDAITYDELVKVLNAADLKICLLGLSKENATGNAFFVRYGK